jgi:predicted metalloendopeptidase
LHLLPPRFRLAASCAALAAVAATLFAGAVHAQVAAPRSGIDRSGMDNAVRPQDDLFRHMNGAWLRDTPMPADKAYIGAFEQIQEGTLAKLRGLIEDAAKNGGDADAKKIGDLYASFMDEAALEKLGVKPLAGELAAIDAVRTRKQLSVLMARHGRLGIPSAVNGEIDQDAKDSTRYVTYLSQGGLGLPDRDYYLKEDDARFKEARAKYVELVAKLLTLAGESHAEASARAVLALETELARVQWTRVENRDAVKSYNPVLQKDLPKLAPALDWKAWLADAGIGGKTPDVIVRQPSYFKGMSALLQSQPLATWKAYAKTRLLISFAPYLSKEFVDTAFAFNGTVLMGTTENRPRWKRGVGIVERSIGESLGKVYVAKYFPPESKDKMEKLVGNLLAAYKQSIDTLDWMGPDTKKQAQAKLATFVPKIGYPKKWKDYSRLQIRRDDLVGNVMRARLLADAREVAKLGKPVDRDEWFMTPQTVNAYYNPAMNEIVFPASILQPPFFDPTADDAANYGGIGAVIGHEISHGFDDEGSRFDGLGNLREWWTAEDRKRFDAKTSILVEQYGAFEPVPGYKVNGELTLGENIADNSGLEIAYKAYHLSLNGQPPLAIDGLSGDERFFLGFAQVWRGKARDQALVQQLKSDPHSPEEIRANGTVRNHPGYYSTFGVKAGDKMYLPPEKRVSIW